MNYYVLPTKYMEFNIDLKMNDNTEPYISSSFYRNMLSLKTQVDIFIEHNKDTLTTSGIDMIRDINNTYSFLHSIVSTDIQIYINELNENESRLFFINIELSNTFDFLYRIFNTIPEQIMYIGDNDKTFHESLKYISSKNDVIINSTTHDDLINSIKNNNDSFCYTDFKMLYFDLCIPEGEHKYVNNTIVQIVKTLYIITNMRCTCVIKIGGLLFKPIIDVIYILTGMYNNVYISKPISSKDMNDRYIICKDSYSRHPSIDYITNTNDKLLEIIRIIQNESNKKEVSSIINTPISCYFLTKIEESTLIIGQKNIDYYETFIMLMKIFGKEDKIENAKKSAIIKCIQWCVKYNIPHMVKYL
jgi:hypothetical protein